MPISTIHVKNFELALLAIDQVKAKGIIAELDPSYTPLQLLEGLVAPALNHIGEAWEHGDIALSQVYMSGRICEDLVNELLPPSVSPQKNKPKMAIAVLEDYHLLGKRIVYAHLRACGFELIDYGHGIGAEALADLAIKHELEILLISTLMLRAALKVKQVKEKLEAAGSKTKILVGGAPFLLDPELWQNVRADAMGRNAAEAAAIILKLKENST
ncbi:hypothetical protein D1AOALGA4SA_10612 [Olavius algarvensis Delta 1 endosymbiont]|nr:hypothetical protein D1AOALGA4SA_10612 [Olavius algarvensis Delta 1 endosymbiont]